ncbi:MAG TPA: hypothetical protein VN193_11565 [Candidatus Angelobacter sp.]|nr:hypothetical protein [Candidatus Angelobacter sp.]
MKAEHTHMQGVVAPDGGRRRGPGARAMAVVALLVAGTAAVAAAAQPAGRAPVGVHTYPAGLSLNAVPGGAELAEAAPLAPGGGYDPNRVADKYSQFQQAAALPLAEANRSWRDVGPKGVDSPTGYSASTEQFGRIAGMGAALAADSNDPSGNTVYLGNMGGLWKSTDGGDNWTNLSDGKLTSAGVGAIALDPSRPDDIYVGTGITYLTLSGDTYGTGFYVSHDGGRTFSRPSPNVEGWAVTRIAVTPTYLLIGTNHGLYRSTDHGDTLTQVALPTNDSHTGPATGPYANWISDIAVRPGHDGEVTVAVGFPLGKAPLADGSIASPGNGLYRSTTGGTAASFTAMAVSALTTSQSSVDPVGRISLAYGQTAQDDGVLWALVSDAGLAYGHAPAGLEFGDVVPGTAPSQVPRQVPNQTGTVLNGLFRSGDDGGTWANKATPTSLLAAPNSTLTPAAALSYAPGVQAYYEAVLVTDPVTPDQVYFGLEEAYQTVGNSGSTPGPAGAFVIERYADACGFYLYTTNVTNGAACPPQAPLYGGYTTHPDQHAMAAVKTPNGVRLYSSNDGGAFRQDSHAITVGTGFDNNSWTALNTLPTVEAWHAVMLPDGEILAALQDNGASLSGADRKGVEVGLGDGYWVFPTANPDVFYIGIPGAALFVTKDHGQNLTEIPPNVTNPSFTSPIAIDPTDPNHLIAAGRDVYESLKGPDTQVVFDSVATGTVVQSDWGTTAIFDAGSSGVVNPLNGKTVDWAATALAVRGAAAYGALCAVCSASRLTFDQVHPAIETNVKPGCTAKKDASDCWYIAPSKGLGAGYINSLVIDPNDTSTVYAAVMERQFVGYPSNQVPGRIYVSHDAGQNFSDVTGNLPRGSVWNMVIRDGRLIAATDVGIFTAPLGSGTWSRLGTGLPAVAMRDVWIDPSGRNLLVSAYGRGVWTLDFGSTAVGSNSPSSVAPPPTTTTPLTAPPATASLPNTQAESGRGIAGPAGAVLLAAALMLARRRRRRRS